MQSRKARLLLNKVHESVGNRGMCSVFDSGTVKQAGDYEKAFRSRSLGATLQVV